MEMIPTYLEEALDLIEDLYILNNLTEHYEETEEHFLAISHNGPGRYIRDNWYLWWNPNHEIPYWPKEEPELNKWFRRIGIVHADDMSGIILTSLYRRHHNDPYRLGEQIEVYHDFWKKYGFKEGIPK